MNEYHWRNVQKDALNQSERNLLVYCFLISFFALAAAGQAPASLDFCDITKSDFFPILPWGAYHGWNGSETDRNPGDGLESIAECNFNMAGFVLPKDLRQCGELGLGAIMAPSSSHIARPSPDWATLSDLEIDSRIKENVVTAGSERAVMGYFIMDEPKADDFPALAKAVAAVKKYAPGKLAYINLRGLVENPINVLKKKHSSSKPNTKPGTDDLESFAGEAVDTPAARASRKAYAEYLEGFVNEVHPQFISYDNYMVEFSDDLKIPATVACYFHNLLDVRRVALEHHLPFLTIVGANQIRPATPIPSPANLLFQAYVTLAAGYRGVTWYTYYSFGYRHSPIDVSGRKTQTWFYLKEVNRQITTLAPIMSRLESTGVFFSRPAPVKDLPLLPGRLVKSATCVTPLMIGEFQGADGQSYVMVVNLSLERSAKFTLETVLPGQAMTIFSSVDRSLSLFPSEAGCWLTAGQGVLLTVAK